MLPPAPHHVWLGTAWRSSLQRATGVGGAFLGAGPSERAERPGLRNVLTHPHRLAPVFRPAQPLHPELALSPDPGLGDLKGLDPELHDLHLWLMGEKGAPAGTLHPGSLSCWPVGLSLSRGCEAEEPAAGTAGR